MPFTAGQRLTASQLNAANQVVGGIRRTTNASATSGTTELTVMTTPALALQASGLFYVHANVSWDASTAGDRFIFRIRQDSGAGTIMLQPVQPDTAQALPYFSDFGAYFTTTTALPSKVFVATAQRLAGTGTCTVTSNSSLVVYQLGADTLLSTV